MDMSQKLVGVLAASCILAFLAAAWVFTAGYGFLAAFLIYSLGGSTLLLGFSALSVLTASPAHEAQDPRNAVA